MLKKTMTYTDYDGNERTEDFYFNLSKAEVAELELSTPGGLSKKFETIAKSKDSQTIIKEFKDLILKSYGEKSPDGKRFIKSKEISEAFSQTEAFSDLFIEFFTVENSASEFVRGIIPKTD